MRIILRPFPFLLGNGITYAAETPPRACGGVSSILGRWAHEDCSVEFRQSGPEQWMLMCFQILIAVPIFNGLIRIFLII